MRDGYAIHDLLPALGIIPIVITGRTSEIVLRRCEELGVTHIVQGSRDKVADLMDILAREKISLEETAFIGDDLNDLPCMQLVGLKGCPGDAGSYKCCGLCDKSNGGTGGSKRIYRMD